MALVNSLTASRVLFAETTEVHLSATKHWTRELRIPEGLPANVLVLVLTKDETSWGRHEHDSSFRTLASFTDLMSSTGYPLDEMCLGILTSSSSDYRALTASSETAAFRKTHVIYHPGYGTHTSRGQRHAEALQTDRRRSIARLRNYLMLRTLHNEQHVVWLDADVYWLSPGLIQKLIQQSHTDSALHRLRPGIITARCAQAENNNYDRNAWAGPRLEPTTSQLQQADYGDVFVPRPTQETKFLDDLVQGTDDNYLVSLDSVGGTVLYINSETIWQGLSFPSYYVIGTTWNSTEGWDGIETEGVCYVAKTLGYGCYGLGGSWVVRHTTL